MAGTLQFLVSTTMLIFLAIGSAKSHPFSRNLSPDELGLKKEKLTHLHFYFHDTLVGKNPSAIQIIKQVNNSKTFFGSVTIADDPLTETPEIDSRLVARAQGIYPSASQSEIGFLMLFNFVFLEGKFNGSSLTMMGHNAPFSGIREMPIVGGSGLFRFARGYALAKTYSLDTATGNAVVEYNVYVAHY